MPAKKGDIEIVFGADTKNLTEGINNVKDNLKKFEDTSTQNTEKIYELNESVNKLDEGYKKLNNQIKMGIMPDKMEIGAIALEYNNVRKAIDGIIASQKEAVKGAGAELGVLGSARGLASKEEKGAVQTAILEAKNQKQAFDAVKESALKLQNQLRELDGSKKELADSMKEVTKRGGKLTTALQLTAMAFGFRKVLRMSTRLFKSWMGLRNQAEQISFEFRNTFAKASEEAFTAANSLINAMTKHLGHSRQELEKNIAMLQRFAEGFGIASNSATLMAKEVTRIANNIAAISGENIESVIANIQSFLSGRYRATQQYGIFTSKEELKQLALRHGLIKDANQELDHSDMMYLSFIHLIEEGNKLYGEGFKNSVVTVNGLIKQTNVSIENIGQNMGLIVEGPAIGLLNAFRGIVGYVEKFTSILAGADENVRNILGTLITGTFVITGILFLVSMLYIIIRKYRNLLKQTNMLWLAKGMAVAGFFGAFVLGIALVTTGILGLLGAIDDIDDDLENLSSIPIDDLFDNANKKAKQLRNTLMGFDKLNILKTEKDTGLEEAPMIAWLNQMQENVFTGITDSIGDTTDKINEMNKALERQQTLFSAISLVIGAAVTVLAAWKGTQFIANMIMKKNTADTVVNIKAQKLRKFTLAKSTVATNTNAVATANNTKKQIIGTKAILAKNKAMLISIGLATFGAGLLAAGIIIASAKSKRMDVGIPNESAKGNFFPSATATIIGERYPEIAIPLGASPQFADMKQDIAERVVAEGGTNQPQVINLTSKLEIGGRPLDEYIERVVNRTVRGSTGRNLTQVGRI